MKIAARTGRRMIIENLVRRARPVTTPRRRARHVDGVRRYPSATKKNRRYMKEAAISVCTSFPCPRIVGSRA
jgi:hypothetical protein